MGFFDGKNDGRSGALMGAATSAQDERR
jgi:hypothetical protein